MFRSKRRPRLPKPPKLTQLERRYSASIMMLVNQYQAAVREKLYPVIPDPDRSDRLDDELDALTRAFNSVKERIDQIFNKPSVQRTARGAADEVNKANRRYHDAVQVVAGVNPIQFEPWLDRQVRAFVQENASLITSIPSENLSDIEQMIYRNQGRGMSKKAIKAEIEKLFDVTQSRAALIAQDQVGKFDGKLTEIRQANLGIDEYTWRTSEDGRVREDHQHLDGKRFKWSEPPITVTTGKRAGERNHPRGDIRCRCYAEPVIKI